MNDLQYISSIKTKSRKKYYHENALKAYKYNIKSYNKGFSYDYGIINEFLQVNNVNNDGINLINTKLTKVNRKRAKNIIEIVNGIDKRMTLYNSTKTLYKGITHISKRTLDSNTPVIYRSYNSTTTDYKTALNFTNPEYDEYRVILILTIDPMIKSYDYKDKNDESEILLERNTIISNFVFNSYNEINKVYFYNAIVSKYNPEPLFIPPKVSPDFLGLKIDKNISPKKMKIFDIKKNFKTLKTNVFNKL
jgi:hypothetical protein